MEELGKLERFPSLLVAAKENRLDEWWKNFRRHQAKSQFFTINALILREQPRRGASVKKLQDSQIGQSLHELKMASLYTDFDDGRFSSPQDLPNADALARDLIALVESAIELDRVYASKVSAETLESNAERSADFVSRLRASGAPAYEVLDDLMSVLHDALVRGGGSSGPG
jgi:AbiV family abortive infection protein